MFPLLLLATPAVAQLVPQNQEFLAALDDYSCPIDIPFTCTNSTPIENSCCFESPGGIMLQTQFWDYYPPVGDNETFTLHGLWPDNCDGTYEQFCDDKLNINAKQLQSIIVDDFNDKPLYNKLSNIWKNFNGDDQSLWVHEFNKHATCIKTLRPNCYAQASDFKQGQNVYDFFQISVDLYEKLPTFKFLFDEGIVPSEDATYTKDQIAAALEKNFDGNPVFFKCNKYRALQEVWYFHHLKGSIRGEQFQRIPSMMSSNCPADGIKFYPKGWKPGNGSPSKPPSTPVKNYIRLSGHSGCLIANGQWYNYGTCATYHLQKSQFGGYNLKSSKGFCGFDKNNQLACGSFYQPSKFQFSWDKETGVLGYGGETEWCYSNSGSHGHGKYIQTPVKLKDASEDCSDSFQLKFK